ncbi:MAG: Pr6Pr family membrane protein [Roseinatronobacter sp.]
MQMDPKYRITAGLIGAICAAALAAQLGLRLGRGQGLGLALWAMAGFFTILTNLMMAVTMLMIAATGRRLSFGWMSMLTLSMMMVGLVYHLLLAHLTSFTGLRWWVDHLLHTILPALMLWFWAMETARNDPRDAQPLTWLIWPALYAAYALARGALSGRYPYYFLNMDLLGVLPVLVNMGALLGAFVLLAYLLYAFGRAMPTRAQEFSREDASR